MVAEITSLVLLAAVLAAAVLRPHGLPEAFVAIPAAVLCIAFGWVSQQHLEDEWDRLWPVLLFLAAVLVLAHLCSVEGLFDAAGHWLASSSDGRPTRFLGHVFVLSIAITSVLSLDATVLLLTPVVITAALHAELSARPPVYAAGHLANSSSLLLPMANLTNLLAIGPSGLSLVEFTALMAAPFAVVVGWEYLVMRGYFRVELRVTSLVRVSEPAQWPVVAVVVLGATLVGFVITSFAEIEPFWVAMAGAAVLAAYSLAKRRATVAGIARASDIPFLCFVLGLAIVVRSVVDSGVGAWVVGLAPNGDDLLALLGFAYLAMVLANVVNNLPALLILVGPAALLGPLPVLAVLIGVNVGPNLTYTGSLATLLWRRVLDHHELRVNWRRFTTLGLLSVPAQVGLGTAALWLAGQALPFV